MPQFELIRHVRQFNGFRDPKHVSNQKRYDRLKGTVGYATSAF